MVSVRTILVVFFVSTSLWASETTPSAANTPEPSIYKKIVKGEFTGTYKKVFTALDNNGYFVLIEPNIGKRLADFEQRWGKDYNKNELEFIRSIVFWKPDYANQVSNLDPDMMALFPMNITLTHKKGTTTILFVRPSQVAMASPAKAIAEELEQDVIRAVEQGFIP